MGKYMRKAKITGDVAVMEVSQSSLGVRTRAKTLALQRLQTNSTSTASTPPPPSKSESCYLELRSRRLEKPLTKTETKTQQNPRVKETVLKDSCFLSPSAVQLQHSGLRTSSVSSGFGDSVSIGCSKREMVIFEKETRGGDSSGGYQVEGHCDLGFETCFGENNLDFDGRNRWTRESTPCSMTREPDITESPGSTTTRLTNVATVNPRNRNAVLPNVPTAHDIEEFFAFAELQQQRRFIEKYNFDLANDMPLPGRYEWVRVNL